MITTSPKRAVGVVALLGVASLVLAGCASAPAATSAAKKVDFKACAVSDEGSWKDKSFNEAAHGGLDEAKSKLGVTYTALESKTTDDFEPNLTQLAQSNCNVIIGVGFNLVDQINAAAEANPKLNYVTIDGWVNKKTTTNLKPITYAMDESSYLAGYLSAAYSKTKTIGTYGGMQIDAVTSFMDGYYYGAQRYAADSGKTVKVLGWNPKSKTGDFVGDFANTAKAKQISAGQIEAGADVIYPVAGGLFSATSEAIKESGKDVVFLGVDKDIAKTQPQYANQVLTSVEKRMTQAVFDVIKQSMDSGFSAAPYVGTLKNDGTALSDFGAFDSKVPQDVKDKLAQIKAGIIDGSIDPMK